MDIEKKERYKKAIKFKGFEKKKKKSFTTRKFYADHSTRIREVNGNDVFRFDSYFGQRVSIG